MTAPSTAPLALPVGDRSLPERTHLLGALLAGAAGLALTGALAASYIGVRSESGQWLPEGFEIDNFLGVMLALTALMSATFAAWAPGANSRDLRRQSAAALILAAFTGFCLLNGVWYLGTQLGIGVVSSPFATLNYALLGVVGTLLALGLVGLLAALAKVSGRQAGPHYEGVVKAAVWFWLCALSAWIIVWSTLFMLK